MSTTENQLESMLAGTPTEDDVNQPHIIVIRERLSPSGIYQPSEGPFPGAVEALERVDELRVQLRSVAGDYYEVDAVPLRPPGAKEVLGD